MVRRLGLAATLYFLWQERNKRLFAEEKRQWKTVLGIIINSVRLKLTSLTTKDSSHVRMVEDCWQIKMNKIKT